MMSVERSFEAWEEVQRHGQDIADRFAQGFTGLIHSHHITPPSFPWPSPNSSKLFDVEFPAQSFVPKDFGLAIDQSGINGVSAILDIGNRLGQAGADFGATLNGVVQQFFRRLPVPFRHEDAAAVSLLRADGVGERCDGGVSMQVQEDLGSLAKRFREYGFADRDAGSDGATDEENSGFSLKNAGYFSRPQGRFVEGRSITWQFDMGNENSSLFLVQLGPILFVRDSTLLLPVHLSKQHLLWYGYDRKFPNGQFTYVAGEGLSTSAFLPICGGLLQAQGQYPGEMRFSFSCKNKLGTRITPTVQWPDKSFTLGIEQALAWKRSGLMLGRSKWNGNVGSSGVVVRAETPLGNVGRPSFSVQLNSGIEF
ncbi:hypothetical protein RJ639_018098 [Escallonia herrerae]|uniref:Uncharacterized protein n=1 Tax=Escallonia herrerae TaxID=1293975 RepID=A0AA88V6W1_9ASTE|nr:hypothetical protein RJ639_018098 [Escallonia herrerae]